MQMYPTVNKHYTCTVSSCVELVSFVTGADKTAVRVVTDVVASIVPLTLVDV